MTTDTLGSLYVGRRFKNAMTKASEMDDDDNPIIPGFKFLGQGAYRYAYLHLRSNVVYKWGDVGANDAEEQVSAVLRSQPPLVTNQWRVRIPDARTWPVSTDWSNLLTMEYATGVPSMCSTLDWDRYIWQADGTSIKPSCECTPGWCHSQAQQQIAAWSNLGDIHSHNVLFDELTATYTIIDMGEEFYEQS